MINTNQNTPVYDKSANRKRIKAEELISEYGCGFRSYSHDLARLGKAAKLYRSIGEDEEAMKVAGKIKEERIRLAETLPEIIETSYNPLEVSKACNALCTKSKVYIPQDPQTAAVGAKRLRDKFFQGDLASKIFEKLGDKEGVKSCRDCSVEYLNKKAPSPEFKYEHAMFTTMFNAMATMPLLFNLDKLDANTQFAVFTILFPTVYAPFFYRAIDNRASLQKQRQKYEKEVSKLERLQEKAKEGY